MLFLNRCVAGKHPAPAWLHEVPNTGTRGRENMTPNGVEIRERRINISKERGNYVCS